VIWQCKCRGECLKFLNLSPLFQAYFQPIILEFITNQFELIGKAGQENRFSPSRQVGDQFITLLFNVKLEIDLFTGSIYFVMNKEDMFHDKASE
jgi:hypothetical protein